MAATLRIVDESEYGLEPRDLPIPEGATVTVHRHRQGADVTVAPGSGAVVPSENLGRDCGATLAQFYALVSCARDVGGAELMLLGRAGECVAFLLSNRALALLASAIGEHFGTPGTLKETELVTRVTSLEQTVARLSEPAGRPDLRDMGATLVDKAQARLLDAQADKLEREIAAEFAAAVDSDRPFQADRWAVCSDSVRGTVTATARDLQGREVRIESAPDRARWLAEALLAGTRQAEEREGS